MKQFVTAVLLITLFATGEAINCYGSCIGFSDEGSVATCTLTTDDSCTYCLKNKIGIASVYTYTRTCASTCTEGGGFIFGTGTKTYCCQTEACNSATLAKVSVSMLVLTVAKIFI